MKIYTDTPEGVTVVQNAFIDQYMPYAGGEFVKVYLYLLRCANTGRELSLSSIADVFEHTEKDVNRALVYWEKQGLLQIRLAGDGEIQKLTFLEPGRAGLETRRRTPADAEPAPRAPEPLRAAEGSGKPEAGQPGEALEAPPLSRLSDRAQKELRQLFFIAEQYMQRPLSSSEQSDFVYYYDTLKFSSDLIEYLLEYCISKGSSSRFYMKRVALGWAEAGVSTVQQAKQETNLYNRNYFAIMNAFGLKGRNPAPPEQEMMAKWINEYQFSMDIILEACRRTICQTHQPKFSYADRILREWREKQVHSMAEIGELDRQHQAGQEAQKKAQQSRPQKTAGNRFNNFSQREYDYSELEKKLLNQGSAEEGGSAG